MFVQGDLPDSAIDLVRNDEAGAMRSWFAFASTQFGSPNSRDHIACYAHLIVGGLLVLIVDDNEDARVLYEDCLSHAGFRVLIARNGIEAVTLAASKHPWAIVMDFQMPDMDGWEAIRRIRASALDPRPHIVALTANGSADARREAYDAGADDFVPKPANPLMICAMIVGALKARE